jgi:serine/threonine-protein kinase
MTPMRITLSVTSGPCTGQVFSFSGHDVFLVGRSRRAHFRLPDDDEYFSRLHFMVEVNPPHCLLADMGSKNGTAVNGAKVSSVELNDGDLIQAGTTVLRVSLQSSEAPAEGPDSAPPTRALPASEVPATAQIATPPAAGAWATRLGPATPPVPPPSAGAAKLAPACPGKSTETPPVIPGYQVLSELGRGGMGVVYLARRSADGSLVAVKTIIPAVAGSSTQVDRFLREADVLRGLKHPHIVSFREMGEVAGQLYFVMDYVQGTDAARLLQEGGPLPVRRAARLICQLLDALDHAHARRFVHRDVKPANLLLAQEGGRGALKLADFGLARVYQASKLSGLTLSGQLGGTIAFMAPEQVTHFREARPPADQYAAGATLYTLLTGRFAYDLAPTLQQQISQLLQEQPVPLRTRRPELPRELADVVHRSLAREPKDRFADVRSMRQALLPFCS